MSMYIRDLTLKIKNNKILHNINLDLPTNNNLAILGPSGSGKTSLIKSLLGLWPQKIISGEFIFNNQIIFAKNFSLAKNKRNFGYIPQNLSLWPHLSIIQTLKFTQKLSKTNFLNLNIFLTNLNLAHKKKSYPHELSGGEKQRLALARALIIQPRLLILDEPFCMLDITSKEKIIFLLINLQKNLNFKLILITHDLAEALLLTNKILLLDRGKKIWFGSKQDIKKANFLSHFDPLKSKLLNPLDLILS